MQKRKFDELISHFNRKVSDMSIDQKYKMELLGMISAIGFAHEKELSTNLASLGTGCISRQQAIDALVSMTIYTKEELKEYREESAYKDCWTNGIYDAVEKIEQLPPIQPEIVRCKDCKYHHKRICPIERYFSLDGFCSRGKRREVTT